MGADGCADQEPLAIRGDVVLLSDLTHKETRPEQTDGRAAPAEERQHFVRAQSLFNANAHLCHVENHNRVRSRLSPIVIGS